MGRFVKNTVVKTGSKAVRLPAATTADATFTPRDGQVRFNTDLGAIQYYYGGSWEAFSKVGKVNIVKDSFVGDGTKVAFGPIAVPHEPGSESELLVFIGNVFQDPNVSFNIDSADHYSLIFTSPPSEGSPIVILHNFNSTYVE